MARIVPAHDANKALIKLITEREWQSTVVEHAQQAGWLTYFIPDSMWRRAFVQRTPQVLGDRGFPDLVLVRGSHLLFRELKTMSGTMSKYQLQWRDALLAAGADWAIWRPSQLDDVIAFLWGENA